MSEIRFMTWPDFDAARRQTDLGIIPTGAVEGYGPHLPLGSDALVAEAVARLVGEQTGGLVAPVVPVGDSRALAEFPGTLTVSALAFRTYLADIARSLIGWGLRRLLFINTHAGNVPIINDLMTDLTAEHGVRCAQVDFWRFIQPLAADLIRDRDHAFGHAGEVGTSVLLYLYPDRVRRDRAAAHYPEPESFPEVLRPRSYRSRAPEALVGDATLGDPDQGAEIIRRAVDRIAAFVRSPEFGQASS